MFKLEVYVSTESDVVACDAKVETILLSLIVLSKIISNTTKMCNKANLLTECVRDTWLDANLPCVRAVFITTNVTMHISEATVSEEREVTCLSKSVTNVWVQNECVCKIIINRNGNTCQIITSLAVGVTNLRSYIKFVIKFVANFWQERKVVSLPVFYLVSCLSQVAVTNFTTNPNLCVCCERCNCYKSCQNKLFHNFLILTISSSYSIKRRRSEVFGFPSM